MLPNPPQGLLHFGKAAWSQAKEGSGVANAFLNPELFLVKGSAAGREGTTEAARERHTKEQNQLPLIV